MQKTRIKRPNLFQNIEKFHVLYSFSMSKHGYKMMVTKLYVCYQL